MSVADAPGLHLNNKGHDSLHVGCLEKDIRAEFEACDKWFPHKMLKGFQNRREMLHLVGTIIRRSVMTVIVLDQIKNTAK